MRGFKQKEADGQTYRRVSLSRCRGSGGSSGTKMLVDQQDSGFKIRVGCEDWIWIVELSGNSWGRPWVVVVVVVVP
jgi:hypothetical protein